MERYEEQPNFFWVNIDQTQLTEREGKFAKQPYGFLWHSEEEQGLEDNPLPIMELVEPGDIIFFYTQGHIEYLGIALNKCYSSKIQKKIVEEGDSQGWRIDIDYSFKVDPPMPMTPNMGAIAPILPAEGSPIYEDGTPKPQYLTHLTYKLGYLLLQICKAELPYRTLADGPVTAQVRTWSKNHEIADVVEDIERVQDEELLSDEEKQNLTDARLAQGNYLLEVKKRYECCPITRIDFYPSLSICRPKPWRVCSSTEKLDPYNSIVLAKHLAPLFNNGVISFKEDGELMVYPLLEEKFGEYHIPRPLHIDLPAACQPYMKWHRENVFKK